MLYHLRAPPYTYLERAFNYEKCKSGIRIRKAFVQSFHVLGKKMTRYGVIDLDNHHPTQRSTTVHLELVKRLQDRMPDLLRAIGGKSSFVQYRGIEPTGIQLWVVTHREQNIEFLHDSIRRFLARLNHDGLDDRLVEAGLPSLAKIEILPTTSKMISMVGCYGKSVFTTKELKIVEHRFDCISLYDHIMNDGVATSFYDRYRDLALVREMDDAPPSRVLPLRRPAPSLETDPRGYWTSLKHLALNGVETPDDLHDHYLEPLAHSLLLREYFSCVDRDAKTLLAIKAWILKKHNGHVSRLLDGDERAVIDQIQQTIKRIKKRPNSKISAYYQQMRANDARFPHRIEHLVPLMLQDPICPPSSLIGCKGAVSSKQKKKKPYLSRRIPAISHLPKSVITKIANYAKAMMRKGKKTERWTMFAKRVMAEIGAENEKSISQARMMILAGKDPKESSSFLKQWKNDLAKAGIIQKGWEGKIIRGVSSSRYSLTPWARQEINKKASSVGSEGNGTQAGGTGYK